MPVASHVHRRAGIYHLRCRVPRDLVDEIGRSEIRRSLGTACPRDARRRAAKLYAKLVEIFDEVRALTDLNNAAHVKIERDEKDKIIEILLASLNEAEDIMELNECRRINELHVLKLRHLMETVSREKSENERMQRAVDLAKRFTDIVETTKDTHLDLVGTREQNEILRNNALVDRI
jgi:hypothetical protein